MPKELSPEQIREWQDVITKGIKASKLTQQELAEKVGIAQSNFSQYQRGPTERMQFLTTIRLFSALGIEPNEVAQMLGLMPDDREMPSLLKTYVYEIAGLDEEEQERVLWGIGKFLGHS